MQMDVFIIYVIQNLWLFQMEVFANFQFDTYILNQYFIICIFKMPLIFHCLEGLEATWSRNLRVVKFFLGIRITCFKFF